MKTLAGLSLKTSELRGVKTSWLDNENTGKDILFFIHGYLDTPDTWRDEVAAFTENYHILLPYGRGVGESAAPKDNRRYGAHSILLDHLEILRLNDPKRERPVHIVGHDIGGVHAWMLASYPDPGVKTVTILNSAHPRQYLRRIVWPRQIFKSWYVGAFQFPYISEALLLVFHREVLKVLSSEGWRAPEGDLSLRDFDGAAGNAMNQYRQFVRDIPHFLRANTTPTETPILVISSEEDRYLEAPSTLEFADIAKNVTIRVIKGKHWIHREQPERINRLLGEFWNLHAGGPK